MKYEIVDVKNDEAGVLSFCAVVDEPGHEDMVYVFEDVQFGEVADDGDMEISVNMGKLIKGSGIRVADELTSHETEFMQQLLSLMVQDFIESSLKSADLNTNETIE